ncbi:hypothetical protein PAPYR_6322 [Paratrimastix pyriformis]|uniref:Uncharacterized protein n=1 Tax=Paratrimastix pyriformis TaxID=342808 RepID=A0ABQ8UMS6_9EUKA|nr:hypothetical protein PAPYR_6322 [Paratrimastix pyriformis]
MLAPGLPVSIPDLLAGDGARARDYITNKTMLRVWGNLSEMDFTNDRVVIASLSGERLRICITDLTAVPYSIGTHYQFWGTLKLDEEHEFCLQARTVWRAEGLDAGLFEEALREIQHANF